MKKFLLIIFGILFIANHAVWAFDPVYHIGNHQKLDLDYKKTELRDKKILFLGSSVTRGMASLQISFVEMLQKKYGIIPYKEAVDGTTLADISESSYVSRLKKIDPKIKFDAVVVQLSTNDAFRDVPIYSSSQSNIEDSIKEISAYVKNTWNIPLIFYTCPYYGSEKYDNMVKLLYELSKSENFEIVDIYNSEEFRKLSPYDKNLYMYDANHPTQIGYFHMVKYFEQILQKIINKKYNIQSAVLNKTQKKGITQ